MAASSLMALLVIAATFPNAHAYTPASDAGFAAEMTAISASALKAAVKMKSDAKPLTAAVRSAAGRTRPDSSFTPGHLCSPTDPNFKEYRYSEHIAYCQRHVTQAMKQEVGAHYGIAQSDWSNYEFDHLIPLSLGGDSSIDNLWPEPNADNQAPSGKDQLELQLYLQIRDGKITQAEAVRQIFAWFDAFQLSRVK
jgi:hypothetical protein